MPQPTWLGKDIAYETGTGPRYILRAFRDGEIVSKCGGNPVSPLYKPQAMRLKDEALRTGHSVEAKAQMHDGEEVTQHHGGK